MLKFSPANAKTEALEEVEELKPFLYDRQIYSLDLLSGHSCPSAEECLSKAIVIDGKRKIKDGPKTLFRCFSASQEVQYTNVYNLRKHNFDTLRGLHVNDMIHRLNTDLPEDTGILRWHVGGDFFNSDYFFAAINVAMMNPDKLFYAYTKSLRYWIQYKNWADKVDNFVLTASRGGREDHLIDQHELRESIVVFSEEEAEARGLEIDHDDSHAAVPSWLDNDFALLVHGVQPAGSEAARALSALKGKGSYGKRVKV